MSDGRISIDIEIDGKAIKTTASDLKNLEDTARKSATGPDEVKKSLKDIDGKKAQEAASDVKGLGDTSKKGAEDIGDVSKALKDVDGKPIDETKDKMNEFEKETQKGQKSVKDFALAIGLVKVAALAFNVLKDSIGSAVDRFDTLEKFPRVLQSMGFEAEQSERAMEKMSNSIEGLPTTLNDMVGLTQKFINITGNLDKSVATSEALNNAMLASGSSSADASRGIEQYSQMLANGEPDMQSWRSVNETMGYGLKRTAEEMLGTGSTAMDLYEALKGGTVTMEEVNSKIIELGGSTGELAELARKNSEGISTSFTNLKNSAVKGLANVMKSVDTVIHAATGKSIAQNLDSLKGVVNKTFSVVNKSIESTTPVVKGTVVIFKGLKDTADFLSPAIVGVGVAYAGLKTVETINRMMDNSNKIFQASNIAMKGLEGMTITLTSAKAKELVALELSNDATKAEIATVLASNGVITAKTALIGVLTGKITIVQLATHAWTAAVGMLNGAFTLLIANPVVAAIAAITAGIVVASKMSKFWNKEMYASNEAMRELTDGVKENSKAAVDNIRERETSLAVMNDEVDASKKMAESLDGLANGEKASASTKKEIQETISELTRLYPELNLQYDENTNRVNQNADAIKSQIEAFSSYERVQAIQENMKQSTKELSEAEAERTRISSDLKSVRDEMNNTDNVAIQSLWDLHKTEKELMEQEEANGERRRVLTEEQKGLIEQHEQARQQALEAQKLAIQEVGFQYDFLSDKQKETVDKMKTNYDDLLSAATSFGTDLSYKLDMSSQDMIKFVENNQAIMNQWADNLKALTNRGANEGFIDELRNMGPEGAKYAQLAVNMSDEEFNKMNQLFENAPKVTEEAWKKAYGLESVPSAVSEVVMKGKESIASEFENSGINELLSEQGAKNTRSIADGMNQNAEVVKEATRNVTAAAASPENVQETISKFNEVGGFLPKGMAEGINQNSKQAADASGEMSYATYLAAKTKLEVNSPSKKFIELGRFVVEGLANGIKDNANLIKSAMDSLSDTVISGGEKVKSNSKKLANEIPDQFNNLRSELQNMGSYAVDGLANGISSNNSALVAANNIANQIKTTIQSALDIHSPSRWMRDEIGRFIPQGIALGIEKDSYMAVEAMKMLNSDLTSGIKPEKMLNVGKMSGMSLARESNNATTNNYSSDFDGFMRGAVFNVRDDTDIDRIADELLRKQQLAEAQRGVRRIR